MITAVFTRAGEVLGYTQSGITQMMKALEKEVGLSLFIKDKSGTALTREAQSLIPAVRALLNADEVVRQEIASLKGAQTGTITIGTYLSCSIHWIPRIIQAFQRSIPIYCSKLQKAWKESWPTGSRNAALIIGFLSYQPGHPLPFSPRSG